MHEQSSMNIVAHTCNGYIGVCECCHEFNFVYKNILLTFQQDELVRFLDWLISYRADDQTYLPLPHGKTRVYKSPLSNLFLTFDDDELDELAQLFIDTELILEARRLIQNGNQKFNFKP